MVDAVPPRDGNGRFVPEPANPADGPAPAIRPKPGRITDVEEAWVIQAATEKRRSRFDKRIDIVARKALLRIMKHGEDEDVVKAIIAWMNFREKTPVRESPATKHTNNALDRLTEKLKDK